MGPVGRARVDVIDWWGTTSGGMGGGDVVFCSRVVLVVLRVWVGK